MSALALAVYHRLPPAARSVAATLRGAALRRWRYGPETERLIEEAIGRESWSTERWTRWQDDACARLLHRAATRVPYYRRLWAHRRRRGDRRSWEVLANWPVLRKDVLRAHTSEFLADDCRQSQMFHEHTSGTSGKALDLWWSRRTVREWYALFEARCRSWSGVSRHDRWAILGGQMVVPALQTAPPFWVWNAAMHQLYMSSYHLSPATIASYVEALRRYEITYLWGYSSALYEIALGLLQQPALRPPALKVALTNAEPLFAYQRQAIERAFGCPVRETYGMAEIVAAASECPAGQLHLWPEVGVIELRDGGEPAPMGESGDLIATGLLNADMPLIRYAVGDRLALARGRDLCACGRALPMVAAVDGRCDDVVITPDGRRIGRLDPVFKAGLPIVEAQIIQETHGRLRIRYVPAASFAVTSERDLRSALRARVGNMELVLEPVTRVPRSANGKFRAVVSQLGAPSRPSL